MESSSIQDQAAAYSQISLHEEQNTSDTNVEEEIDKCEPVCKLHTSNNIDHGYAWIIIIVVFSGVLSFSVFESSTTLTYSQLLAKYGMTATATGWVFSMSSSVRMFSSPLVGLLYGFLPHRMVAMIGVLLYCLGLMVTGFAPAPCFLYIGYGLLSGFGISMFVMTNFIIISTYFEKKRGKAMGIAFSGTEFGGMLLSPLVAKSYDYLGCTTTLTMCACVAMQALITTGMYRPLASDVITNLKEKTPDCNNDGKTEAHKSAHKEGFASKIGISLLLNINYLLLATLNASSLGLIACAQIYLSGLVQETCGLSNSEIALLVSLASACKLPAMLLAGFMFDLNSVRPVRMYIFPSLGIVVSVVFICLQFCHTLITFVIPWCIYTIFAFAAHSQHITLVGDILTTDKMPKGIAIGRVLQGITVFIYPTIIGYLKDNFGSYTYGLTAIGSIHLVICVVVIIVYPCLGGSSGA